MSIQFQFRRGNTTQNNSFTGVSAEISIDTSTNTIRVHDAVTAGGVPIMPTLRLTNAQRIATTPQLGQIVYVTDYVSAGVSPTWIGDGSTAGGVIAAGSVVASASTSTNILGGTAGQVPYQTGAGTTNFFGPGTVGQVLLSGGITGPSYSNTLTYSNGTVSVTSSKAATSTTTGALVVTGGMGIGGDVYIGGKIVAQELDIQYTTVTTTLIQTDDVIQTANTTPTNSTLTGALKIAGGAGFGGSLYVGGVVTATNFSGSIAGGSTGAIVYQSAASTTAFLNIGTSGYILTSNGSAPTWTALTGLSAGNATTSTNLAGGTAGQVPYQTAGGATGFFGPGSFGQFLISGGTGAPSYSSTLTMANGSINVTGTADATTTQTGALIVTGGVGIGGNLQVGGNITAQGNIVANGNITLGNQNTDTLTIGADVVSDINPDVTNTYNLGSSTQAWKRIWTGDLTASGVVTATTFVGALTGTASTATSAATAYSTIGTLTAGTGLSGTAFNGSANQTWTLNTATLMATAVNLASGTAGQLHYQSAANTSGFINTATTGNFLQANYAGAPTWTTTASMYVNRSTVADSVANALTISTGLTGTAGTYNGSAAVTLTLNTATLMQTATQVVQSHSTGTGILGSSFNGSTAQTWSLDTSTLMNKVVNLAGGAAGGLPYQSGANATTFLGIGTNGYVLTSNGSAPVWSAASGITAGYAAQVQTVAQPSAATYYPTFVSANNASATAMSVYTTSSLYVNAATGYVGIGASNNGSRLTVAGRIESTTDDAAEGGQVVLRGKTFYRWSIDNYQDQFRIIREDDSTGINGVNALQVASNTNATIMLGVTSPYGGERLSVNGGVYVNGIVTATTFVGNLTGAATTATSAGTAYATIGTLTAGTGLSGTSFNGSTNQTWTLNTATLMQTSVNLAGGSAGQFAYQSAANTTAFMSTGSMYVGYASNVNTIAQTNSANYYPAFVDSNNASAGWEPVYTTSSFYINPATGVLTVPTIIATSNSNGMNYRVGDDVWIGDIDNANTFRVMGVQDATAGYIVFGNSNTTALGRTGTGGLTYGGNLIVHGGNTSTTYVGRAVTADATQAAVTFNNSNSGDASGITFNGGTARTVSANTLGALSLSGGGTISGAVTFSGPVTFSGTATYVSSTQTYYTDNIINIHVPPGGVDAGWTLDDGKDIGFRFHYFNGTDTNAALVIANDSKFLEYYAAGAEGTSTFVGSYYGNFKTGNIIAGRGLRVGSLASSTATVVGEKLTVYGGIYSNDIVTATTFVGALTGTASNATTATSAGTAYATIGTLTAGAGLSGTAFNGSANQTWTLNTATLMQASVNLASGTAGQLHYQSAANTSGFINTATTGNFLQANYAGAPTWTTTASMYVQDASVSTNIRAGAAGSLPYQSGANATTFLGIGTNGYVLTSNGTAPTWSALSGLSAGTATTATNLAGGTAGQIAYQTAAGSTSFAGPGTAGQLLMSAGTSAPTYTNTASIYVKDANISTNIRAGVAGQIPVQSAVDTTTFVSTATTGNFLQANYNSAPTWTTTGSMYVQNAVLATHQRGGTAGQLQYQSAVDTTAFINTATTGNFLQANYVGAPTWTTTASMYVQDAVVSTNLRAGAAGSIPYQSGANATTFLGIGTNGYVLTSNGSAPTWSALSGLTAGSATTATSAGTAYATIGTLTAGTGLSGTAFNGSANQTWTLNTATLMATAVTAFTANKVANTLSAGTGLTGSAFDGSAALTWTLNTATLMQVATQVVQSHSAGTGLTGSAYNGSTAQTWSLNTATLMQAAVNLGSGAAGSLPYQTGANATGFLSIGTNGYVLTSNGTAPTWTAVSSLSGAGSVAYAVTFNSGGSGDASGTSYNGSAARTISYNTLGAAATNQTMYIGTTGVAINRASGALSLTGVSIDGTAASETLGTVTSRGNQASGSISVATGEGYGYSFWNDTTNYKISMGTTAGTYQYGPVTDYSIKMQMDSTAGRGFTWGTAGNKPIAALNALTGNMQLGGTFSATNAVFSGNMVVGASTSTNKFEVRGTAGQLFSVSDSFTGTIFSANDVSGIPSIEVLDTGLVKFAQYNGQVAINTSTAQTNMGLTVNSSTYVMSLGVGTVASGTTGEIRATNEITAYYSDRRLKENVKPIDNAVTKVLSLNGITYTPNEVAEQYGYNRTTKLVGLFADEVEAVLPEATRPAPFDVDENGGSKSGENYKTIQYEKLVPLLIEAVKEQQATIDNLKAELASIKSLIAKG